MFENSINELVLSHELDDKLRDIKAYCPPILPLWLKVVFICFVFALIAFWIYKKFFSKSKVNIISLYESTINKLKDLNLNSTSKDFYLSYSEHVKNYLEFRIQIAILDKTAEELKEILINTHQLKTSSAIVLAKIFSRADLAKFAKHEFDFETKSTDLFTTLQILEEIENLIREKEAEESARNQANV